MSKANLKPEAERLYVKEGMTLEGIAGALGVVEKTIRLWRDAGNWEDHRANFIKGKEQFHQELFRLAQKLAEQINTALEENKPLDSGRIRLFVSILDKLEVVKGYEEMVKKFSADPNLRKAGGDLAKMVKDVMFSEDNS